MTIGVETQLSPGRCPRCGGLSVVRRNTIPNNTLWCDDCRQVTWTYGHYPVPPTTETRAEESAQYSPLPWQEMGQSDYAQPEADSICCIGDHNGYTIAVMIGDCIPDQKANADLIVHRVNSFETLVRALEEAQHIVADRAAGGRMIWTVTDAGVYLADVLALQCETGLITHQRESEHLRVRRQEKLPCPQSS